MELYQERQLARPSLRWMAVRMVSTRRDYKKCATFSILKYSS